MLLVVGFVLPGSSSCDSFFDEAARHPEIYKASKTSHSLNSSASCLAGFPPVNRLCLGARGFSEWCFWPGAQATVKSALTLSREGGATAL